MSDGTIRTEGDLARATFGAVHRIRRRYNDARRRLGMEPVSFADRSPFEQADKEES